MTEAEWSACVSPRRMLKYLWERGSARKLRLFAVACARRVCHLAASDQSHRLEVAERFADGNGSAEELRTSWGAGLNTFILGKAPVAWGAKEFAEAAVGDACDPRAADAATWAMDCAQDSANPDAKLNEHGELPEGTEHLPQVILLRDIFGNPFRPVSVDPSWLTSTVLAIAGQMYASRDFTASPIIADALKDAGCDDEQILDHCRSPGPHVRGCWVVDLVLGRG